MVFYKGDIIWPIARTQDGGKLRHPAVVWDDTISGNNDFTGIMLSSVGPPGYPDNILMEQAHFLPGFYKNTHFINRRFIKLAGWGPFEKVGTLTKEGISFIESRLSATPPLPFDVYKVGG